MEDTMLTARCIRTLDVRQWGKSCRNGMSGSGTLCLESTQRMTAESCTDGLSQEQPCNVLVMFALTQAPVEEERSQQRQPHG